MTSNGKLSQAARLFAHELESASKQDVTAARLMFREIINDMGQDAETRKTAADVSRLLSNQLRRY